MHFCAKFADFCQVRFWSSILFVGLWIVTRMMVHVLESWTDLKNIRHLDLDQQGKGMQRPWACLVVLCNILGWFCTFAPLIEGWKSRRPPSPSRRGAGSSEVPEPGEPGGMGFLKPGYWLGNQHGDITMVEPTNMGIKPWKKGVITCFNQQTWVCLK